MPVAKRPHELMTNLVYPAFLGTFLVSTSMSGGHLGPASVQLAVFLLLYFVIAFEETVVLVTDYSIPVFLVDAVEVALMVAAFVVLGVATVSYDANGDPAFRPQTITTLWGVLSILFTLPFLARIVPPSKRNPTYDYLCAVAVVICFLASLHALDWAWSLTQQVPLLGGAYAFLDRWPLWTAPEQLLRSGSDHFAHATLWVLMVIYVVALFVDPSATNNDWARGRRNLQYVPYFLGAVVIIVSMTLIRWLI